MVDDVAKAAYWAYRERFLYDKGGDIAPMVIDAEVAEGAAIEAGEETVIDVVGILESEGILLDDKEAGAPLDDEQELDTFDGDHE